MKGNRAKGTGKRKLPAEWSENVDESKPPEEAHKSMGTVEDPNQPETQEPGPAVDNNANEVQEPPGTLSFHFTRIFSKCIREDFTVCTTYNYQIFPPSFQTTLYPNKKKKNGKKLLACIVPGDCGKTIFWNINFMIALNLFFFHAKFLNTFLSEKLHIRVFGFRHLCLILLYKI